MTAIWKHEIPFFLSYYSSPLKTKWNMLKIISVFCFFLAIPLDGEWSPWTPWTQCSKTCGISGGEILKRTRLCNQPPAMNGGKPCVGNDTETAKSCLTPCPGGYSKKNTLGCLSNDNSDCREIKLDSICFKLHCEHCYNKLQEGWDTPTKKRPFLLQIAPGYRSVR